ncbi:Vps53-like N-terminal [Trinorchestia longiramus]|nr:Vps53-like N-terminal [Trinorchestia longiramus]
MTNAAETDSHGEEIPLNYSPAVVAAIQEIVPGEDAFDAPDFDAVDYINERFPAEQSLHLLDDVLEEMRIKLTHVEDETRLLVRQLAINSQTGQDSLLSAEESIRQLSARFQDIKVASGESEQRVRAITRDIRQLDTGKRNLTASINTLNHLQMLTEGVDKIRSMKSTRQYGELAPLLQGVLNVMHHLSRYTHIPQVKQLADQVSSSVSPATLTSRRSNSWQTSKNDIQVVENQMNYSHVQMVEKQIDCSHVQVVENQIDYSHVQVVENQINYSHVLVVEDQINYSHVQVVEDQINYSHVQVVESQLALEQQILADFKSSSASLSAPSHQLAEACLVANVLDRRVRKSIIDQVLEHQLAEYKAVFAGSERDGWLSSVDLRRKWFLRAAVEFDKTLAQMFPPNWKLTQAMVLRPGDVDSTTLLQAHRLLSDMESLIIQKYGTTFTYDDLLESTGDQTPKSPEGGVGKPVTTPTSPVHSTSRTHDNVLPTAASADGTSTPGGDTGTGTGTVPSPYDGAITSCFLPYLHIYLNTVDKRLGEQLERFMAAVKTYSFDRVEEEESNVMPCCGELFTLYKNMLVEYLRISMSGYGLPNLITVFQRRLREFATRVLREALPQASQQGFGTLPKDMKDISAIISQVQSLLVREGGESLRLSSEEEVRKVCSVLVSAEYCAHMTNKLQAKLGEKWQVAPRIIPEPGVPRKPPAPAAPGASSTPSNISLAAEEELFHAVLSQCILLLVGHVESLCEPSLSGIPKHSWLLEQTGDQSPYVSQLSAHLTNTVPLVRYHLHTSRKHFTRFCDKLAASICTKFTQQVVAPPVPSGSHAPCTPRYSRPLYPQVYRCRPINSVGCEQLLLDCHALKAVLLHMPVLASKVMRDPPVSYTRMVTKNLARPELVLQVVMGEYSSNTQLLEKSIRLMPDLSLTDFQKVLELRGIKDKASLLESYRQRTAAECDQPAVTDAGGGGDAGTAVGRPVAATVASPEHELSRIAKLEKMLKARRLIS